MPIVEAAAIVSEALTFPDRARAIVIRDQASYDAACEFVRGVKALRVKIADTFRPHIKRADEAHSALLKEMREADDPLAQAEKLAKDALATFNDTQARLAAEQQRRDIEAARAREEERRMQQAIDLERRGQGAAAEAMLSKPVLFPAPPLQAPVVNRKGSGVSFSPKPLGGTCVDLLALVKFIAEHPTFVNLVQPNGTAINSQVRALGRECDIPGIEVTGGGSSVSVSAK
jgi:hypothetical protein